ncbi:PID-CTERM protein-sorting domain-containing protein [uncultured Hymenobacter sp.]|uniref:PID-CTERM protein-sorting domain-containing protein n=1 Tax=uncultured Hymenobacter sp. TaxID=170016 RepID=UPI0035CB98D5
MKKDTLVSALCGTALCVLLTAASALAQGPGSGGPTPTAVPIDGGASLLLASGVAYGLKKLRDSRRKR